MHTIQIRFTVTEGDGVDVRRIMEDSIRILSSNPATGNFRAKHTHRIIYTDEIAPPRPTLERQVGVSIPPEELTDDDRRTLAEEAFPSAPEDPFVWGGEEEPRTETELHAEGGSLVASTDEEVAADDSTVSTIVESTIVEETASE